MVRGRLRKEISQGKTFLHKKKLSDMIILFLILETIG
jgi:hypothetical protein